MRVAPLASGGGRIVVVGGAAHEQIILDQLDEVGLTAQVLLEPEARDSAAAMAAAAVWTERHDAAAINVFVASDHHIPDDDAFRRAATQAAEAASGGRVVTLGVRPDAPSSAYGYIAPESEGLSAVKAFVEKPDATTAASYIKAGYLWNSGNFIVAASVLLEELRVHAPAVEAAARAALPTVGDEDVITLGAGFAGAPKISIDYAVMERTCRASVLAVDFAWSDLGSWDAVGATGEGDLGVHVFEDAEGCVVRACDGVVVAAIGVRNLAIVAERDAVLVCDLSRSQDVRRVVDRLGAASPQHVDFPVVRPEPLSDGARRFAEWMRLRALPLWSAIGQDEAGLFFDALSLDGRPIRSTRRARVQARQIQVFAQAGRDGWGGPWATKVHDGLEALTRFYLRGDGLMRSRLDDAGAPLDETAMLYDQAFYLYALATVQGAGRHGDQATAATGARDVLLATAPARGGLVEQGPDAYQANANMHLLEACLAWCEVGGDSGWSDLADRLVDAAVTNFIDVDKGFLREFYQQDWRPAQGEIGRLVEPGHQFEWAWLLTRYAQACGRRDILPIARRLYENGLLGVDRRRHVVMDALNDDGTVRSRRARLWPQAEWLKAALLLAECDEEDRRASYLRDAATAQRALMRYLTPDGLWNDKLLANDTFMAEAVPASSFYHVLSAWGQVSSTCSQFNLVEAGAFRLGELRDAR